jgi:hypothetical protein
MQARLMEGYIVGILVLLLGAYVLWQLEWRLDHAQRVGTFGPDGEPLPVTQVTE